MGRTQRNRQLGVLTSLGEDVLLLREFKAREELGRPFAFELDMLSEDPSLPLDSLVGHPAAVRVSMQRQGAPPRWFHGILSEVERAEDDGRLPRYRATMVPWLWFLTLTSDCRIFQHMTAVEVVQQVLRDFGMGAYELNLTAQYPKREYCVQYGETAFDFVSRLMEEEGIYYFFRHEKDRHVMVLCDAPSAHAPAAGYEAVTYLPNGDKMVGGERLWGWTNRRSVTTTRFAATDFDFKAPQKDLMCRDQWPREHGRTGYERFEYPGGHSHMPEGEHYARIRMEELQARHEVARGEGNFRGLGAGHRFRLVRHPLEFQNRDYLVISATHHARSDDFDGTKEAEAGSDFKSVLECVPLIQQFRPARTTPRPRVYGPQTATVTGPENQELWIDKYARIKVQFHWDRRGQHDQNSSCWVRVNQPWAGKNFGGLCVPRIGQEVIVDFLEGDPDRPLVTGRLYNGASMPPISTAGKQVNPGKPKVPPPPPSRLAAASGHALAASGPTRVGTRPATPSMASNGIPQALYDPAPGSNGVASMAGGGGHGSGAGGGRPWAGGAAAALMNGSQVNGSHSNGSALANGGRPSSPMAGLISGHASESGNPGKYRGDEEPPAPSSIIQAAMMTTIKSNSLKQTGGSNEITMNDSTGEEGLYIKAQYDEMHEVGHDELTVIGNNRVTQVGVDSMEKIGNNLAQEIGSNAAEKVGASKVIEVGETLLIKAGTSITLQCGAARIHMNQAGFITISGSVVAMTGSVAGTLAAPLTNVSGMVTLINGILTRVDAGARAVMSSGGDSVVKGAVVKIN